MIDQQIDRWADDLIDLTGRNRLLYFKHTRSRSLEFSQEPDLVESRLDAGWRFYLPERPAGEPEALLEVEPLPEPEPPRDDQLCVSMQPERYRDDILRCLRNLKRQTQQLFLDRGLWLLHIGLGILRWTDNGNIDVQSPLLLVPVELNQTRTDWKLERSDYGEPVFNPALTLRLKRDFDIEFSLPQEIDTETTFAEIHVAVESAVRGTIWTIEPRAVLDLFTFHKMPMYDDLKRNSDRIGRHPTVRLLAEGPSSTALDLSFDPVPEKDLDQRQPPEDLQCVLDADASQRQCIAAASDERSFAMDGPPGTGKSQTITNIISQLLADGKTVLFVSEKAAALDVVHSRMEERKLDSFVLALHSHKATRKAVATELGKALSERPNATEAFNAGKRQRLLGRRRELSGYATAVNELRRPLEKTRRSPSAQRFGFTDDNARPHIGEMIVEILRDSPHIHRDVVRRLVLDAWSIARGGRVIQRAFDRAVARLLERGAIEESAGFLHLPGIPIDAVRVPHYSWGPRRRVEHVPRGEGDTVRLVG